MLNFTSLKVYFKNKFINFDKATVNIANTSFLYGLGVFTGMRAHYNETEKQLYVFRPQDHYKRLKNSCTICQMNHFIKDYSYNKFLKIILKLLKINKINQDVYIRVSVFIDDNAIGPKFGFYKDALAIYLYPLGDYVPTDGMKCQTSSWRRIEDNAIPARTKVFGAYVNTAFAKTEALQNGYDEAIVLDNIGHVVEGSAENIFIVRDNQIITPPITDNILEGVTRKTVMEIAQDEGIPVIERSIDRTELYIADEVFFSGTGAKVSPVTQIDNYKINNGKIGPISKKIQKTYFDAVKGKIEQYKKWVMPID